MNDRIIKAITADGGFQITAACTTGMVEQARQIHKTLPVATAALGRTLTAASMMGSQLKTEKGSVTVQIKGNGPLGTIVTVADHEGNARGYLQNPAVDLPLRADGKLDVGGAVGPGYLMVIKDVGMKEPVSGTTALVNGEIAEDITRYFVESEQIPSACALGVLVDTDQSILQAGGYLVQVMPGASDEGTTRLEENIAKAGAITGMFQKGMTLEDVARTLLDGFEVRFLSDEPVAYKCGCSEHKVIGALVSLGREELTRLSEEEEKMEITCQFCDRVYAFSKEEIADILAHAIKKT